MSSESSCKEEVEDRSVSHTQGGDAERESISTESSRKEEVTQGGDAERGSTSTESSRKEEEEDTLNSLDVLSDDLLEKLFSFLPTTSIINASAVSKRWCAVVHRPWAVALPPEAPWYFMTIFSKDSVIHLIYNQSLDRWSPTNFPIIPRNYCSVAGSGGLVCLINNCQSSSHLFVCNPITTIQRRLPLGPPLDSSACALAMSADRQTKSYIVAVVNYRVARSKVGEVSIHIYESKTEKWFVGLTQPMNVCECRHLCTICGGILYCLFFAISHWTYYLLAYDLKARPKSFVRVAVPTLPRLTNPSLINLREKLVMVGLIFKNKPHSLLVNTLAIWELDEKAKAWREVAYLPWKTIEENLGRDGSSFVCSGSGDLIYMQSYNSPAVLTFDMARKHWKWLENYPIVMGNKHIESFVGYSFEPNLKMDC